MTRVIVAVLEGAWEAEVFSAVCAHSQQFRCFDWRPLFAGLDSLDDNYFRGDCSDSDQVSSWAAQTSKLLGDEGVYIVPSSLAEVDECFQILRSNLDLFDGIFYVTASANAVWNRLGLNLPGVPLGLGPVRATWLKLAHRREQCWESLGAEVIDSSHCDAYAQEEAIFSAIRARITPS